MCRYCDNCLIYKIKSNFKYLFVCDYLKYIIQYEVLINANFSEGVLQMAKNRKVLFIWLNKNKKNI